jgi:hypothetical protein
LFCKRLRNYFPVVSIARSTEVTKDFARGYFHVNVIVLFDEGLPVYEHRSKKRRNSKGNSVVSWRLADYSLKSAFADLWDAGFVDVRAIESPKDLCEYALKYHIKEFTNKDCKENQRLTLSTLTLFGKRSFSFPRGSESRGIPNFAEAVISYTVEVNEAQSGDNMVNFLLRLDIIVPNSLEYSFLGCKLDVNSDYANGLWFEVLDKPPDLSSVLFSFGVDSPDSLADAMHYVDSGARFFIDGYLSKPKRRRVCDKKKYEFLRRRYE